MVGRKALVLVILVRVQVPQPPLADGAKEVVCYSEWPEKVSRSLP